MVFLLKSVDAQGNTRDFAFTRDQLESGLDIISSLAVSNRVLSVEIENVGKVDPTVFDGEPLAGPMAVLEQDWQAQLNKPISYYLLLRDRHARRIDRHRANIDHYAASIDRCQQRLASVEKLLNCEPYRSRSLDQLRSTLDRFEHNLRLEQASLRAFLGCSFQVSFPQKV